ncbi:retropepsin-like domain-containing protein [Mangrovimonas sp. AS39]|uniref:retropepsin-like domain-containing protein n=1 Tax=Mangrovimonas futianensis TaxID=2895523 RepID=UPI001E3A4A4B|nr:retropepsin-like domain-containing protein [Mangrovimonas futianensis]MCF1192363.1 retropepsin-like domain-containing protein [Mangrovimonas futianensis]MCF1195888.1 retropepsin-like domain-containing protein [Mangrovimonas futianensis]
MPPKRLYILLLFVLCYINSFSFTKKIGGITFPKAEILNEYTARIPFKMVDHLLVIEAEIFEQKGNFIIDTGSETLILNKVHFPIQYEFNRRKKATSGVVNLMDDAIEKKIKEFVIQNLSLSDKVSDVIDLSHIEKNKKMHLLGIIGFQILQDYEVFIDLYLNQITLTKVDRFGTKFDKKVYLEKITDSIPFTLVNHTIVLKATVNDQTLKFGLDTAAEVNQLNKRVSRKALKYFKPNGRLKLTGASGKQIEVLAGKLHLVKLTDQIYFGPMDTILTNLSQMNEAFGVDLDGILGYEFFRQKRTIINYQKEKLYFVLDPITKR